MKNNKTAYRFFLLLLLSLSSLVSGFNPDSKSVTGKVLDASTKEPLIGATILIKGTKMGTYTDLKGEFKINNLPSGILEMQISMVGYKTLSKKVDLSRDLRDEMIFELTEGLIEIGTVVVTGTVTPHLYEDAPVKTEVIPHKLIEQQQACNLAEALGLQTGLMVANECNNCNFTQVQILGFEGKYTQVLIDGDPAISTLGGVYGLEHYPKEMIDKIEVVKGGGSSLYGGGAIAGTINLLTKKPSMNRTQFEYKTSFMNKSADHQVGAFAEISNKDNTSNVFIFGSARSRDSYDHNNDGFSELGVLKNSTIGLNWFYTPDKNIELQTSFHRLQEDRRGGSDFDKPVHEARTAEWTNHIKWGGKIKFSHKISPVFEYKINYAFSLLSRDSYYGGLSGNTAEAKLQALKYYGVSKNPLHTGGIQMGYAAGSHNFIGGLQYDHDNLDDRSAASENYYINETFRNLGFYLQDEINIDDEGHFQFVAGIRFDKHSALENIIVSPRLNLKYEILEGLMFRAGYASGFKAPQIFNEDLHICGLEGTQRIIRNSIGLKEERSNSYTMGLEFQNYVGDVALLAGITGFYTRLDGAYAENLISSTNNIEYWERINSSGADVYGIEFDFGLKPVKEIEIRTGVTIKNNKYDLPVANYNTREFFRTPDLFGYLRASVELSEYTDFFISVKYTGDMFIPHEIATDTSPKLELYNSSSFYEVDLNLAHKFRMSESIGVELTAGIKNLTNTYQTNLDTGISRDPNFVYGPSAPRTFFVTLGLSL